MSPFFSSREVGLCFCVCGSEMVLGALNLLSIKITLSSNISTESIFIKSVRCEVCLSGSTAEDCDCEMILNVLYNIQKQM